MELARFPSRGGFSVRSIITFVASVLVAVLLWAILAPTPAQAATEASFVGDVITFDGHTYNPVSDLDPSHGLATGTSVYIYYSPDNVESRATSAFFIYFAPGTDPPTATSADFVAYDYDTRTDTFSNPHDQATLTMEPSSQEDSYNSCTVTGGLGWIICPVTVFMAEGMDFLFEVIGNFLTVQPLNLNGETADNGLYIAWNIMRNIANIAFVIAFLIIIYSQLIGGTTNYSLKKLIPRLVVAAVLVNISYVISALAVDISNILGWSVQSVFEGIRKDVFHISDETLGAGLNSSWAVVTAAVLGGGGAVAGVFYVISSGAYFLLIPILLLVVLTALLVLVVLAARQAIIIILIIIAPLAFVANLLPNTEKWFTKWRDLFMTMLIFFPAFSLVFGGAQLAGQIIIMNAGDNIIMVIFGMAVQIAPLVITPLLLKLSGNLLGKIAQIANNPNKGLLDRNKKWANDRAELARHRSINKGVTKNPLTWGSGMVRANEFRRRNLQGRLENAKKQADNTYHGTEPYKNIHLEAFEVEVDKQIIENEHKAHIQTTINARGSKLHLQNVQLEAGKRALEAMTKDTEATIKEYEAGRIPGGASTQLQYEIGILSASKRNLSLESIRSGNADTQIQRELATALKNSASLRDHAAGIKELGADSVLASAVSAVRKAEEEDISNIQKAANFGPGKLDDIASALQDAIREGNNVKSRAYQNMLVTAGGSGLDKYRKAIIAMGASIPSDVSDSMRDNLLDNHGALKAKANDILDWAAKGGLLQNTSYDPTMWAGLGDKDFIAQHPKSQVYALDAGAFTRDRAQAILLADQIGGNILTEDIKERLRNIT